MDGCPPLTISFNASRLKIKITLKYKPNGYLRYDILVSLQIKTYILKDI
jgi:hypothetical protein